MEKLKFKIVPSKYEEAKELLKIQKEVFHSDLIKYKDFQTNPAAESWENFVYRMFSSSHFSINIDNSLAGGICVVRRAKDHNYLYRIFLGTEYQNKGLGSKIIRELERQFPGVNRWTLDTPKDNQRNRHFYEKLGYKKTGDIKVNEYLTLIEYEKILGK